MFSSSGPFDPPAAGIAGVGRVLGRSSWQGISPVDECQVEWLGETTRPHQKSWPSAKLWFFHLKQQKVETLEYIFGLMGECSIWKWLLVHSLVHWCEQSHSFWDIHLKRWLFAIICKTRKRPQGIHCTLGAMSLAPSGRPHAICLMTSPHLEAYHMTKFLGAGKVGGGWQQGGEDVRQGVGEGPAQASHSPCPPHWQTVAARGHATLHNPPESTWFHIFLKDFHVTRLNKNSWFLCSTYFY